jgi:hypothetical protein
VHAALVANGLRVLPLPRAWYSLDNACALSPICDEDGRREGINGEGAERSSTRLCSRRLGTIAPQDVFGAATYGLRRDTDIKAAHEIVC